MKRVDIKKAKSTTSLLFDAVDPHDDERTYNPPPLPKTLPPSTSTESEENFRATKNTELPVCPDQSTHTSGRGLCNNVIQMPPDQIYNQLYNSNNFMNGIYSKNKIYDITYQPWLKDEGTGNTCRTVKYTMELPPTGLGPKISYITEEQTILSISKPGDIYVVEVEASNSGIPYADHFSIMTHCCITRESQVGDTSKYFACANIKYKKSTWGFIKVIIEKNAFNGMESIQEDIGATLQQQTRHQELQSLNIKRRKKRPGSADFRAQKFAAEPEKPVNKKLLQNSFRCWLVILVLVLLGIMNVVLFNKLKTLEMRTHYEGLINLGNNERTILRSWVNKGRSWEDVTRLLEKQEQIHVSHLQDWVMLLSQTAQALEKAEASITELRSTLIEYRAKRAKELIDHITDDEERLKAIKQTCSS